MNENKESYEVFVCINLSDTYCIEANSLEEAEKLAENRFKEEHKLYDKPDLLECVYASGGECDDN